jgi:hypothetical protein
MLKHMLKIFLWKWRERFVHKDEGKKTDKGPIVAKK